MITVTARFVPGEVTPEQLEQYRQAYEAARQTEQRAMWKYEDAYRVYSDALFALRKAKSVYEWAKHGMVQEPQP